MLILELPEAGRTRIVGLVGSCRLHDPFKAAVTKSGGRVLWSSGNAFTHTLSEAAQHVRHCRGELIIDDDLAPFVFKSETSPSHDSRLTDLVSRCTELIVEVSSFTGYRVGDVFVNVDYFSQAFLKGRGLAALNWFRTVGPDGGDTATGAQVSPGEPTPMESKVVTSLVKYEESTTQSLAALEAISGPDKTPVVLCPIFNSDELPPHIIAGRRVLKERVIDIAEIDGSRVVDLSPTVAQAGAKVALDASGADFFHFAPAFLETAGDAYVKALASPAKATSDPAVIIQAMRDALKANDMRGAERAASQLVDLRPDNAEGWFVLGRSAAIGGDWASARTDFSRAVGLEANSEWYLLNLARAEERIGDRQAAVEHYRRIAVWADGKPVYRDEAKAALGRLEP